MARLELGYFSHELQKAQRAVILVPEDIKPPYKPLLLLHGLSDDESIWTRRTSLERYLEGKPLIVVMPDGGRGWYCDAQEGYAYGRAIGEELPKLVDTWFQTLPGWGVGGLSMGGYGAVRLALTYPDRFKSAHAHSGALAFGHWYGSGDDEFGQEFRRVLGPNPEGGPNDLFTLTEKAITRPRLKIDCGETDFLIEQNRAFNQHLAGLGWGHVYEEFPGEHTWSYWDTHIQSALEWHLNHQG